MTRRTLFVPAILTLLAVLILVIFGIATLTPVNTGQNTNQDQNALPPLTKPTIDFGNPYTGPWNAPVTIVEFGDYLCQPCAALDATIKQVMKDYPGKIRLVWKDAPDETSHAGATDAAIAARCAAEQGRFWQYHDLMFSQQNDVMSTNFVPFAAQLGLNLDTFQSCITDKHVGPLVQRDVDQAKQLQVTATPTMFINDRRVVGAISYDELKGFVDAALAKAGVTNTAPTSPGAGSAATGNAAPAPAANNVNAAAPASK